MVRGSVSDALAIHGYQARRASELLFFPEPIDNDRDFSPEYAVPEHAV